MILQCLLYNVQWCTSIVERSYPTYKVRGSDGEELPHAQGKEQRLHFAGAAVKRYPTPNVREIQDSKCCKRASEGRHTETILTEN